jgi:hypothetical protein
MPSRHLVPGSIAPTRPAALRAGNDTAAIGPHVTRGSTVRRAAAAVAAMVLVSGACSGARAAPDRAELLTATPPRSTACLPNASPERLPAADVVVDSASLVESVARIREAATGDSAFVLLTMAFDREGMNIRRTVIEHNVSPILADSVQRLVFASRRELPEADEEWGVRLRVDLVDPVGVRVGRREYCPPAARSPELDAAMHRLQPMSVTYRSGVRERVLQVRARVNEVGVITSAQIARGELQGSSLERAITDYLRQFLFDPATVDGTPVPSIVQVPIRVRG